MVLAVNQKENETQVLQKTNKELEDYIASLENSVGISSYQGKPLSTVKNKFRTLKTFISRAEAALWFFLTVKESDSDVVHNIKSKPNCQDSATQAQGERKYST